MTKEKYRGLLKIAAEQVPKGIYAVEKGDYAELCNHQCSTTKRKEMVRAYKQDGYRVYWN